MPSSTTDEPIIRRRAVQSRRRRDGLIQYARDLTSQNGEDGIIARIFELLPPPPVPPSLSGCSNSDNNEGISSCDYWCVDVGAWDGCHLSNTYSLLVPSTASSYRNTHHAHWHGVLIEANQERFQKLKDLHDPLGNVSLNIAVSVTNPEKGLDSILRNNVNYSNSNMMMMKIPRQLDFVCIDIDGGDYWLLHDFLEAKNFRPRVICIEFNPTMPDDLIYIPVRNDAIRHGASLAALVELAETYAYTLVETTLYNAFFVERPLYEKYLSHEVKDTSIEALHEITMGTSIYQLYDGTIKLWGCKKLLWHRLAMDESKFQVLPPDQRKFPFAPQNENADDFDAAIAVDMSPYCCAKLHDGSDTSVNEKTARSLLTQLRETGFCYVRGTGISSELCQDALSVTNAFLQNANEDVRRSTMTKDRARRGYSPMCTENFSSLVGQHGPNDLVRKFRMGPIVDAGNGANSLLQPNVWPDEGCWDADSASAFQSTLEAYYEAASRAAQSVVLAICDGLLLENPELQPALEPFIRQKKKGSNGKEGCTTTSSILTCLGYRVGTRHKGNDKGPLVAPHTDVGVITMLLFDNGNCAALQRSDGKDSWVDVCLPSHVPRDPVFVVNVADCLSEMSQGNLPSTFHQVVAKPAGKVPRNCCALFVGLEPEARLWSNGTQMSFEEWRKLRILRAQNVLRSSKNK